MNLEHELDGLYRAPAAAFVTERNRIAKALKQAGRKDDADAVARLAKPSPVAWGVNQLHFHAKGVLEALYRSGVALREAQENLASGDEFTRSKTEHQKALRAATDRALSFGEEASASNAALRRRIETTLNLLGAVGGNVSPPPGRMSVELEPVGFETLSAALDASPSRERTKDAAVAAPSSAVDAGRDEARAEARAALEAAETELAHLEKTADGAAKGHEKTANDAEEAIRRAEDARRVRDDARREMEAARTKLAESRAVVERLRRKMRSLDD
jgi:hypothetical protein